jgi:hypothetical protein
MSFNRLTYDPATYQRDLDESMAQGKYQMFSGFGASASACSMGAPQGQAHGQAPYASIVDQHSELMNLTRPLTKNPLEEYPFKQSNVPFNTLLPDCGASSEAQHGRYTPFTERRDIAIIRNENEGLCENPQNFDRIISNTRSGMNSRLLYRDNFKEDTAVVYHDVDQYFAPNGDSSRVPIETIGDQPCNSCQF